MKVIILALRRSGSTIFWQCFRDATESLCFDEPFNPKISQTLPRNHSKNNLTEFIQLLQNSREKFWELFDSISPQNELKTSLTSLQIQYLQMLLSLKESVVIDTTRCWHKISNLRKTTPPDTWIIHLHRSPSSWISSHLLPSEERHFCTQFRHKNNFWSRDSDFNRWGIEELVGREPLSPFHLLLLKDDQLAAKFYTCPAVYRLLKFWALVFEETENIGKLEFKDRFLSVSFEEFCAYPQQTLEVISKKTGIEFNYSELPKIKAPKPGFMPNSPNWERAAHYWNLPETKQFLHRDIK